MPESLEYTLVGRGRAPMQRSMVEPMPLEPWVCISKPPDLYLFDVFSGFHWGSFFLG